MKGWIVNGETQVMLREFQAKILLVIMRAKNDGLGSALSNELSDEVNQKGR